MKTKITFLLIQNFLCSAPFPQINDVLNVFFVTLSIILDKH